ncbi:flagellar hook assembly protein FlgD [Sagittula salina]|uniref:Basal-body rod modification protein FlgD n=1 Tax=Sagittula salina TaxID=2820268 RepID=A0A940MXB4_9RHOB|nr:flagellar hook assembly protein FlgD [Sagittula salina]MBP0484574.1 flagellar hook assembly protein FlgD [Sagittula salina]
MAIDPLGLTAASSAAPTASASMSQLSEDYQSFITLLTAQIQNQDPLEPMDSTTFISQLAQLSQVEQAVSTNDKLDGIATQLSSMAAVSGLSLIGRTVVAPGDQVSLADGSATVGYRLSADAAAVRISVQAADGTLLRMLDGSGTTGGEVHQITWDGDDYEGLQVPDGTYNVVVEALDAEGYTVPAQAYASAQVASMTFEDGLATLHLENGRSVAAGLVEEVR